MIPPRSPLEGGFGDVFKKTTVAAKVQVVENGAWCGAVPSAFGSVDRAAVPREGVEPSCLAAYDFESYVYTNSTIEASICACECSKSGRYTQLQWWERAIVRVTRT